MFEHVVVSGCSLTYGEELINSACRYPKILAKGLDNSELKSFALTGVSNEIISQNIINGLISVQDKCKPENTLVIVQWTFASRLNYVGKRNSFYTLADFSMAPSLRRKKIALGHANAFFNDDFDDMYSVKSYYDYHTDPSYLCYNLVKLVHHTQSFLKSKGYRYIFLFAGKDEKNIFNLGPESFEHLHETMFEKDFIPPYFFMLGEIDKENLFPICFLNFAVDNKFPMGPMHHPLEKAHVAYGNLLLKYVKEKFNA